MPKRIRVFIPPDLKCVRREWDGLEIPILNMPKDRIFFSGVFALGRDISGSTNVDNYYFVDINKAIRLLETKGTTLTIMSASYWRRWKREIGTMILGETILSFPKEICTPIS